MRLIMNSKVKNAIMDVLVSAPKTYISLFDKFNELVYDYTSSFFFFFLLKCRSMSIYHVLQLRDNQINGP